MIRLILFLVFLIASVYIGMEMMQHPGYLLIVYQPWTVEMPLWFAVLCLIVFISLFYLLIYFIMHSQFLWLRFKNWLSRRRERIVYSKTQHGLAMLIEGKWKKAERLLISAVKQTNEPLINYLAAAKAADEQKAYDRRDQYIQNAYKIAPAANLAIGLTQAELEFKQNHFEHVLATLNQLRQKNPHHPEILKLLEKIYIHLGDFENLHALLPSMRKAGLLNNEQVVLFEKNIYCEMLHSSHSKSLNDIQTLWQNMPRQMRKNPEVVYAYVQQLNRFPNTQDEIAEIIRKTMKNGWSAKLVDFYSELTFQDIKKQFVIVGAWVRLYGERKELLFLQGKLCKQAQLWGKAKDYFTKCLAEGPNREATLEYGSLLELLEKKDEALAVYKEGLGG